MGVKVLYTCAKVRREPLSHGPGDKLGGCNSVNKYNGLDYILACGGSWETSEQWSKGSNVIGRLNIADRKVNVWPIIPKVEKEAVVGADSQGSRNLT